MAKDHEKPKIGAGHAAGMMRAGLKEIAQVLPAFPGHTVQPVEEQGLVGNLVPSEVLQTKGEDQALVSQEQAQQGQTQQQDNAPSYREMLAQRAEQAKAQEQGMDRSQHRGMSR